MSVIGFDIGNESCVIAAAKNNGIDVLLNDEAKRETPSVVSFGDKQRFLGSAGAAFVTSNPKSTVIQIKRLIGRLYKEPSVQEDLKLLPFVTSEGPRGGIVIELEYLNKKWTFLPVEILGMLFTHLKQVAEKNLESPVVDCVIGIPSYFTDLQRREYLDAARISGLRPLKLIHDGTAIALGYGMYKTDFSSSGPTNIIFVDIGHCDTQVTVASFEQSGMKILSHSFDSNLGGRDFDEVLFRHFSEQFKEMYKIDVYSNPRASVRLRASCAKLKKVLSVNAEAPLSIECLIGDTDVSGLITREEFEKLSLELLERITVPCYTAFKDSGLTIDKIYTIELVGSGSRIPAIVKRLTVLFNKEPTRTLNASECVARGCALHCAMLSPTLVRDYKVQDVFPYTIALCLDGGKKFAPSMVFPKGSPFPVDKLLSHHANHTFYLQVWYTNKTDFPSGISPNIGHFMMGPCQTSCAEKVKVFINVQLNEHGVFEIKFSSVLEDERSLHHFHSQKMVNNRPISVEVSSENLSMATTKDELREAQEREKMLAKQDKKVEESKDQRNTLESFVYDTRSKLSSAYRSFATDSEKKVITKRLQEIEDWLYEDSDDEMEQDYTRKLKDLKKLLEPVEKKFKDEKAKLEPLEDKYKDEKAKEEATKSLLTLIEEYRAVSDTLPPKLNKPVKNECVEVEKWLNKNLPKNFDSVGWSNVIKQAIDVFKSNCKYEMGFKPSVSKHNKHVDSKTNLRTQTKVTNKWNRIKGINMCTQTKVINSLTQKEVTNPWARSKVTKPQTRTKLPK